MGCKSSAFRQNIRGQVMAKLSDDLKKLCMRQLIVMKALAKLRGDTKTVKLIEDEVKRRKKEMEETYG
jgi:hypothetical protein